MIESTDPYTYPGTNVLKNLRDIREVGLEAGFVIDWSRADAEQMMAASRESASSGNYSGLVTVIRNCLT